MIDCTQLRCIDYVKTADQVRFIFQITGTHDNLPDHLASGRYLCVVCAKGVRPNLEEDDLNDVLLGRPIYGGHTIEEAVAASFLHYDDAFDS